MAIYNFQPIYRGDTFHARKININVDENPEDLTDAVVEFLITTEDKKRIIKKVPVTITNEIEGEITMWEWDVDLPPHNYIYEFRLTLSNNHTHTYMDGKFPVLKSLK